MSQHEFSRTRPRRLLVGSLLMALPVAFAVASCSRLETSSGSDGGGGGASGGGSGGTASSGSGGGPTSSSGSGSGVTTASSGSGSGSPGASGSGSGVVVGSSSGQLIVDASTPIDAAKMACADAVYMDPYTPGYSIPATAVTQAQALIGQMSTKELADQMRGTTYGSGGDIFRTPDNTTRNIKGFLFRDGPRGVVLAAQLPAGQKGYSTAFPVAMARGATFDLALEQQVGLGSGDETLSSGHTMLLAPVIETLRHPAWGRAQETYGEDVYLLGRMGSAYVSGVQHYVPACAKHYTGNNIENGRASLNAQMDDETLHEIYGRQYEMVIQEGGVACIMGAYNLINGTKSCENSVLLTDMLRTTFGFKGMVLTDWWALPPGNAMPGSAAASTTALSMTAAAALNAGLDMETPNSIDYSVLETLVGNQVMQSQLVTAATRIVEQKLRFNVASIPPVGLNKPTTTLNTSTGSIANDTAHIQVAYQAAIESMVLLKNDNNTLPINKATVHTIAVVGASVGYSVSTATGAQTLNFATDVRLGDLGSSRVFSDPAKSTGPAAGITTAAGAGITVMSGNSASVASTADFVVVVAGLTPYDEGEEYTNAGDRTSFALDAKQTGGSAGVQNALITAVSALKKPMVVVLEGGSVIDMPWLASVPAVVMAWYPGMDGGHALGDLLFGNPIASGPNMGVKASFSGKLPITWPKAWADEPAFTSGATTVFGYYVGYRWFEKNGTAPLFAFGHGLSYTTFTYSNLFVPCNTVTKNGVVNVTVDITNTGTVPSDETALLFVAYPNSAVANRQSANYKELKGFSRTSKAVQPGTTVRMTIPLRVSDLKYWDTPSKSWKVESGAVNILVGPSYDHLTLNDTLTIN